MLKGLVPPEPPPFKLRAREARNLKQIHQMPGSAQGTLTAHLTYEADRNHKLSISNDYSSPVLGDKLISSYTYLVDAAGRRTHRVDRGDAFTQEHWTVWSYDNKSQVTKSRTYEGTDLTDTSTEYTNYFREYWYDNIGNRHKHQDGTNVYTYLANNLNQYTNITPALPGMGVTQRHDLDGNLRFDGARLYSWNAENRLWINRPKGAITNGMERLSYYYDYMGRRYKMNRLKRINGAWVEQERHVFLYHGWNIAREDNWETGDNSSANRNVWGLDLIGHRIWTGGVGALLIQNSIKNICLYDINGNISVRIDNEGQITWKKSADQFGVGYPAGDQQMGAFNFNTKMRDASLFDYFGLRTYTSIIGRWNSRDPNVEFGGLNLMAFVNNRAVNSVDILGKEPARSGLSEEFLDRVIGLNLAKPGPGAIYPEDPEKLSRMKEAFNFLSFGTVGANFLGDKDLTQRLLSRYLNNQNDGKFSLSTSDMRKILANEGFRNRWENIVYQKINEGPLNEYFESDMFDGIWKFNPLLDGDLWSAFSRVKYSITIKGCSTKLNGNLLWGGTIETSVSDNYNFSDPNMGHRQPFFNIDILPDKYRLMREERFRELELSKWVKPFKVNGFLDDSYLAKLDGTGVQADERFYFSVLFQSTSSIINISSLSDSIGNFFGNNQKFRR